ncbi:MAG: hypothetical protein EOO20_10515 [Chryseobacterium sp.]|nr:MAG: hypothetical protein EOO20_10515 [Chryseobacterium sp.]
MGNLALIKEQAELNLFLQPKSEVATLPIENKKLLTSDKADLSLMASLIVQGVDDGHSDALDSMIIAKKGVYVFTSIVDALKNKVPSPGANFEKHFCKISERSSGVKTYFEACNDELWLTMKAELEQLKGRIKAREEWLKGFSKATDIEDQVDEETGELIMSARTIFPPVKTAGSSIVISIQ